jgi:hypothetical protein
MLPWKGNKQPIRRISTPLKVQPNIEHAATQRWRSKARGSYAKRR